MSNSSSSQFPKYKVTTEYLGIADNKQVEEEIITILKGQFLAKITSDATYLSALQSSPRKTNEER